MKEYIKIIKKWVGFEEVISLGTCKFYYTNADGIKILTISATFLYGDKGTRDINLQYANTYSGDPKNHPYYHHFIVPWLNSTGWAASDDSVRLRQMVNAICEYVPEKTNDKKIHKVKKKKQNDNIIPINFDNNK